MSRYQQLAYGVRDGDTGRAVLPRTAEWRDYLAWLAAGNTPDPEPSPDPQQELRRRRHEHRQRALAKDAELGRIGVAAAGTRFRLDADDRGTLIGVLASVTAGNALPSGFGWRDRHGVFTVLTQAQLKNLVEKLVERDFQRRRRLWELLDAIDASPDPDRPFVNDAPNPDYVDVEAGWPA